MTVITLGMSFALIACLGPLKFSLWSCTGLWPVTPYTGSFSMRSDSSGRIEKADRRSSFSQAVLRPVSRSDPACGANGVGFMARACSAAGRSAPR